MKACKSSVCQYVGRSFERTDVPPVATSGQVAGWGAESILRTKCLFIVRRQFLSRYYYSHSSAVSNVCKKDHNAPFGDVREFVRISQIVICACWRLIESSLSPEVEGPTHHCNEQYNEPPWPTC